MTNILIARDEAGRTLKFEAMDNYGVFFEEFVACMGRNGHGCVLNIDSSGPPLKPVRMLNRRNYRNDDENYMRDITMYNKANELFKQHCEVVFASAKASLGTTVRSYLDIEMESMKDTSYTNILRMFRKLAKKYGEWTNNKGQRNYYAMLAIPKFNSIDSVYSGLKEMKVLMDERISWKRPEHIYNDSFYRQWLLDHMQGWDVILFLYNTIEADESIGFRKARKRLLNYMEVQREKGHLAQTKASEIKTAMSQAEQKIPNKSSDFIFTDNAANLDDDDDYEAMNAEYRLGRQRVTNGICFNCQQPGHVRRNCPNQNSSIQGLRLAKYSQQSPRVEQKSFEQYPQQQIRATHIQQQQRQQNPQQSIRSQYQQQGIRTQYPPQTQLSSSDLQPTRHQMQIFQMCMQQHAAEQVQNRKRPSTGYEGKSEERPSKYINRGAWPPKGTGPPRITGNACVQEQDYYDESTNFKADQQYFGATGTADEYQNDDPNSLAYYPEDINEYVSDY